MNNLQQRAFKCESIPSISSVLPLLLLAESDRIAIVIYSLHQTLNDDPVRCVANLRETTATTAAAAVVTMATTAAAAVVTMATRRKSRDAQSGSNLSI